MAGKYTAETEPYTPSKSETTSSQGTSRTPGGPQGHARSAAATGYSHTNSQGTTRTVGGGRPVASTGQSGSQRAGLPLTRGSAAGPKGRAQQASEAGWVPGAQGPSGLEGQTGRSGGRAAAQGGAALVGVQVGGGSVQVAPPAYPKNGVHEGVKDKNVSTPVSGS